MDENPDTKQEDEKVTEDTKPPAEEEPKQEDKTPEKPIPPPPDSETKEEKVVTKEVVKEPKEEVKETPAPEKETTAPEKKTPPKEKTDEAVQEKKDEPADEKKDLKKEDKKESQDKDKIPEKPEPKKVQKTQEEMPPRKKPQKEEVKKEPREVIPGLSPLIFGKYDLTEVEVEDPGLRRYINLNPVGIPHTGAKHANRWFGKTKINIVERLINNMMRTEHSTGKKNFAYTTVRTSFEIIAKRTKKNPVQILIYALQNSSPKEEITRLRFGGISVPKAVDTSASHRLDVALRNICKGAVGSSHKNKKRMSLCLAEEIILASKADMNSYAISKKEEMERIAASAR